MGLQSPLVAPDISPLLRPHWSLSLYPQAGEGGGCLWAPRRGLPSERPADPDRAVSEAVRRARVKIRRYAVANGLNRLGTLTYAGAGCHEPAQLREDAGEFFRALRPALGGKAFPYLWLPEWHPGGHGLHVHFAVSRYVGQRLIREVWQRGHVHIKLLSNLPVGSGTLAEARLAAGYLSKYVGKGLDDERRRGGLHRYEVAQGFQPERIRYAGQSEDDVIAQASERMGRAPETIWRSSTVEGWHGPPACWVAWPD
jgi:hypothetical protein